MKRWSAKQTSEVALRSDPLLDEKGDPRGVLLSVRGYDFDFGEELSEGTAALIPGAVDRILALAGNPPSV